MGAKSRTVLHIRHCPIAEADHAANKRQYAHTNHRKGIICVCRAFHHLPDSHYYAILAHEIGHVLSRFRGGEKGADKAAWGFYGVQIQYKNSHFGAFLQYLNPQDIKVIKKSLRISTNPPISLDRESLIEIILDKGSRQDFTISEMTLSLFRMQDPKTHTYDQIEKRVRTVVNYMYRHKMIYKTGSPMRSYWGSVGTRYKSGWPFS